VRGRGRRLIGYGNEDDDGDLVMMDGGHVAIDVDSLRVKELGEDDEGEEEEEDEVTPKKKAKGKEKEEDSDSRLDQRCSPRGVRFVIDAPATLLPCPCPRYNKSKGKGK
jgi:hypothetical protein